MASDTPHIDPVLFKPYFEQFKTFVENQSGIPFVSFASNPYTEKEEGYKYEIYRAGREALAFHAWRSSDIGTGQITDAVIEAIQIPKNNLVPWQGRFGDAARPHHPLFEAKSNKAELHKVESCLFRLYREINDADSFEELIPIFGRTYPLLAYLFFLKDRSRYLSIKPTFFDRAFALLGTQFKTSHRCSWENYTNFIALIGEVKTMLAEELAAEVSLLDAHSFTWMLVAQMKGGEKPPGVDEYLKLPASEREAIVKARIGQGRFRQSLIDYWTSCAVTGCLEPTLLRASHIKPWKTASLQERLSLYNGLLLSPTLDACFDAGYVTFDDEGRILISKALKPEDAHVLGIHPGMRLRRIATEHREYLAFHRARVFK